MKRNKPSATAALVLKALLFAAYDANHGGVVSSDAAAWSKSLAARALSLPRLFLFAVRNPPCRWLFMRVEGLLNSGFILHVAARKAFIDRLGRAHIAGGARQIIVIGAGYDTFALRAAGHYRDVPCFEIDHPRTQAVKRLALANAPIPGNLSFVSADLSMQSITDVLSEQGRFDRQRNTLVVIEGVLMYLPEHAVQRLFKELISLFGNGVTCVFTFMERRSDGDIQFATAHPAVNWWLRRKRERFLWGIERDRIGGFLIDVGFAGSVVYDRQDFLTTLFHSKPVPLAQGELVCVTTRPEAVLDDNAQAARIRTGP